jgi:hypothetical protein
VVLIAGLHVPVILLLDVVGRLNVPPLHIGDTCVNVGVIVPLFTDIVIVVVVAHSPADGVNVYVVVAVLLMAGLHVPVIPLLDVVGNADKLPPVQIAGTCVNEGTIGLPVTSH